MNATAKHLQGDSFKVKCFVEIHEKKINFKMYVNTKCIFYYAWCPVIHAAFLNEL